MPTVVHVTQPVTEGVARCVAGLVRDQRAAGWDATVLCPPTTPDSPLVALSPRLWEATRSPGPSVPGEALRLRALLRDLRPDLVHLHSSKAGLAGRLALRGRVPTVFSPHSWSFHAAGGAGGALALHWERLGARWADRVLCVSRAEADEGVAAGVRGRWAVVANGVDLAEFPQADAGTRTRARAELGLDDAPWVVCVGRLAPQKGQDLLLAGWDQVRAQVPGARLALVGGGPDEAALAAAAGPGVLLAGPSSAPRTWLAAADVVAVPSRWEGMALVVLEAMATARSVVATDVGAARECLLAAAAPAGAVVPADDVAALVQALVGRLQDPSRAADEGRAGRAAVEREHDLATSAARTREVYAPLLSHAE